jgi:hypothetical protein
VSFQLRLFNRDVQVDAFHCFRPLLGALDGGLLTLLQTFFEDAGDAAQY